MLPVWFGVPSELNETDSEYENRDPAVFMPENSDSTRGASEPTGTPSITAVPTSDTAPANASLASDVEVRTTSICPSRDGSDSGTDGASTVRSTSRYHL